MTGQQLADELLSHWQLLWPLPAVERIKRIDEIEADLLFEQNMRCVERDFPCQTQ